MDLQNRHLLFVAQYAAPYVGNFLTSLIYLESVLNSKYNCTVAYVFPELATNQTWYASFSQKHLTFITSNNLQNAQRVLTEVKNQFNPHVVHTHFDGYDIVVKRVFGRSAKIIWHMHNHLSYLKNPIKALYQSMCFWTHYGWKSKGVNIIAVSEEMADFASKWQKRSFLNSNLVIYIPNGIDFKRIANKRHIHQSDGIFRFLAFGGRNSQKRIDILIEAAIMLKEVKHRNDFKIFITKGTDTDEIVKHILGEEIPSWLVLKNQTEDIASLFNTVDCFVSCSCHETFSYAVCEASVFGLPIIQSDIKGTMWNAKNPSVKLFHVNEVNDLCEKMLSQMNEDRDELEKHLQITAENNMRDYSLEKWACNVIDFYKKIK